MNVFVAISSDHEGASVLGVFDTQAGAISRCQAEAVGAVFPWEQDGAGGVLAHPDGGPVYSVSEVPLDGIAHEAGDPRAKRLLGIVLTDEWKRMVECDICKQPLDPLVYAIEHSLTGTIIDHYCPPRDAIVIEHLPW